MNVTDEIREGEAQARAAPPGCRDGVGERAGRRLVVRSVPDLWVKRAAEPR